MNVCINWKKNWYTIVFSFQNRLCSATPTYIFKYNKVCTLLQRTWCEWELWIGSLGKNLNEKNKWMNFYYMCTDLVIYYNKYLSEFVCMYRTFHYLDTLYYVSCIVFADFILVYWVCQSDCSTFDIGQTHLVCCQGECLDICF